ncbi:MAG: hypothetical protein Q7V63_05295 [Gammaproteobacteria bacterium]|nr:hypothetical protein [Gammaproteobacteria bacterium]
MTTTSREQSDLILTIVKLNGLLLAGVGLGTQLPADIGSAAAMMAGGLAIAIAVTMFQCCSQKNEGTAYQQAEVPFYVALMPGSEPSAAILVQSEQ